MSEVAVSIGRVGNSLANAPIRIALRIALGKTLTLEMTPEEFALALTGASDRPATMRLRNLVLTEVKREKP